MAGKLTTHALDTARGCGAAGMAVTLRGPDGAVLASATLDEGGRATLLPGGLERGKYDLVFEAAAYHRAVGVVLSDPPFLDRIIIAFGVSDPQAHYHVPLLLSPYSYSTYRGS
jgi:5-hydroxyisourate hydrolase